MVHPLRVSPSRLALSYVALSLAVLGLFAIPLWYAWSVNFSTFKEYVHADDVRRLTQIFEQQGPTALAAAIELQAAAASPDKIIVLADPTNSRLAGNLSTWPAEVPDAPGTYGLVIESGNSSSRIVGTHVVLPGGYHLLLGAQSARFQSLVDFFWSGIAAATIIALALGAAIGWMIRRALLFEVQEISRAAGAIIGGDLSSRLPTRRGSSALDMLARTVNDMLERLAQKNVQLEREVAVRRQAEHALHRAHEDLEVVVAQRTAQLAEANSSLRRSEARFALAVDAAGDGHSDWVVATDEFYASPRLLEMGGLSAETAITSRDDFLRQFPFHPDDRNSVIAAINEHLFGSAVRLELEMRIIRHGAVRWLHLTGLCSRDESGALVRWNAAVTDVTDSKQAEAALLLSEERYARAMEASEEGHWEWNMATDEMFLSTRIKEILGLATDAHFSSREAFFLGQQIHPDDRDYVRRAREGILTDPTGRYAIEYRIVLRPDETRWVRSRGKVFDDKQTGTRRITGTLTDITDRKLAHEALRHSEERFALAVAGSNDGIWDWDVLTDEMFFSQRAQTLYGLEPGVTIRPRAQWRQMAALHPEDSASQLAAIEDFLDGDTPVYDGEWRVRQQDGRYRWVRVRGTCVRDELGRARRLAGSVSDIDSRKRAEASLQLSEQRYALAMAASEEGFWDWNIATDEYYASPRMLELYGFAPGTTFEGRADFLARFPFHPEDRPKWDAAVAAHFAGESARFDIEMRMVPYGELRWIRLTGLLSRDATGKAIRWTGAVTDVTARKSAEEALRLSEHRYALAMEATGDGHWDWDIPSDKIYVSPLLLDMCGLPPDIAFANRAQWVSRFPFYPGEDSSYHDAVAEHFAGRTNRVDVELRIIPRGDIRWVHMTGRCSRDALGKPIRWAGSVTDVTARKRVEEELRARQDMLELAQKAARAVAFEWWVGSGAGENRWSPDLEAMYGIPPGSYDGTFESWKGLVHRDDWPTVQTAIHAAQESGDVAAEYRVVHGNSATRWLQAKGRMFLDAEGKPSRVVGFMLDVTDRHLAEEELRRLEHQLRQAQRLEAMGTLAGGIAHDFNNLLGAILGYGEMALRDVPGGTRLRRDLENIMIAGERGRALVDRILAFSRSGMGERVAVRVDEVVRETLELFRARLPGGIAIEEGLRADSAGVMGDATQIHQVLMNLATNAVQAMPNGGILRISLDRADIETPRVTVTGSLAPREYVVLKVADTGSGIAPETLERIFDPFFTTKDVGIGTGLGLSLVHGIVTGLGGAIDVSTSVGEGSIFTVYLPSTGDITRLGGQQEAVPPRSLRGAHERVMVVEDESALLSLVTRILSELNYSPVGFSTAAAALDAFRADPMQFDVIVTDESMPGTSGSTLIRSIRELKSTIPIVLVSGYLSGAVVEHAREAGASEVLKKPLSARDLAESLGRLLTRANDPQASLAG